MRLRENAWEWLWVGGLGLAALGLQFRIQWIQFGGLGLMLAVGLAVAVSTSQVSFWDRFRFLLGALFFSLAAGVCLLACR